ncbi:RNA polymerase sigma factor [Luteolibacter sp. Populi]|uniref:RNA polymerase sigma factor n=1 Tax=Luteolibacter sp. Populi TaxID=3230487 RepID=UPI0034655BCF
MSEDSKELLERFVRQRSEAAFRELVRRHSPLVFGTALRKLDGDRAAAQDVTQEVFTLLVRKAAAIEGGGLVNWLYRQACRRASNQLRTERRRKNRELVSATAAGSAGEEHGLDSLGGELDDALMSLPSSDREALVLRYFEQRDFRTLGGSLGISEEAARKRVNRALEKLSAMLKRRGIALGTSTLGTTMSGMGATVVPEGMVSTISVQALRSLPAAGSLAILPLAKSILAGSLLTSLVAGAKLAADRQEPSPALAVIPAASDTAARSMRPEILGELPPDSSLEAVIEEIKRVQAGPANSLARLRISAILERVSIARIPEFIALANTRLSLPERASTYGRLLDRWCDSDPEAVTNFVLREKVGEQVGEGGSSLLNDAFHNWVRQDTPAASAWLMAHWNDEEIGKKAFYGTWRTFFSLYVAEKIFIRQESPAEMLAFIRTLPSGQEQAEVLRGLCGGSTWHDTLGKSDLKKLLEFHHALKALPDESLRREATADLWKFVATTRPGEVAGLLGTLEAPDRFAVSLGLLGVYQQPDGREEMLSGGMIEKSEPVSDRTEREKAAMEAAAAAGLTHSEALSAIAPEMLETLRGDERYAWLDAHRGDLEIDSWLAEKTREAARGMATVNGESPEMEAIAWASRISDPDLRLRLSRAAFRRMFARDPKGGMSYPANEKLPADLAMEFRRIIAENP